MTNIKIMILRDLQKSLIILIEKLLNKQYKYVFNFIIL